MANMKFSFDSKKLQKSIANELQKAVQQEQIAASVAIQSDIGGIKMLDRMCEEALTIILREYDGNANYAVHGEYDLFPAYMRFSHKATFEKLKMSGVIASYLQSLSGWSLYLTPNALTYFSDKEKHLERNRPMFRKLPSNSNKLLQEILAAGNPTQLLCDRFENCSGKEDNELRSLLRELIQEGYISIPQWADDVPCYVEINNSAKTYNEREAEYERQLKASGQVTYNVGSITASGSNLILGDVINSSLSIDNSYHRIKVEIEEKGGEDKEKLNALLDEAKEIIENIEVTRQIPKNKGFFNRLSSHLEKHGWFYAEIVGFIGTATLLLLQG